jgi:hypothetical protein
MGFVIANEWCVTTKATRCQNDWAHKGVNDGLGDWAADHP